MKLISPLDNELTQGQKYNFRIESSVYNELYLLLGVDEIYELIVMDKDGISFTVNEVMVHGEYARISYKNDIGRYITLVEFTTKGTNIDFPKTSETPFKKSLESPLASTLIIGQTYTFKIKCDTTDYNIKLYDTSTIALEREENTYTKTIEIKSGITQFLVVYGPVPPENQYQSMYIFTVSS